MFMYNVIICDDNSKDRKNAENIVNNFFEKEGPKCRIYSYNDYDKEFDKIVKSSLSNKIYLLDIETPTRSGIDVAREIRMYDVESVIMFFTAHDELGNVVLKDDLMFLSFINKFDNFESRLNTCLKKSLRIYKHKSIIKLCEKNVTYTINLDDILYITTDSFERKTILVTTYGEIKTSKTLNSITKLLDSRFIQTHRACFINSDKVSTIDKTKKLIKFNSGITTDLLSDRFKKRV